MLLLSRSQSAYSPRRILDGGLGGETLGTRTRDEDATGEEDKRRRASFAIDFISKIHVSKISKAHERLNCDFAVPQLLKFRVHPDDLLRFSNKMPIIQKYLAGRSTRTVLPF